MSINKVRRFLYLLARILGDINAIKRGPRAMAKRQGRKVVYKFLSRRLWTVGILLLGAGAHTPAAYAHDGPAATMEAPCVPC